MIPEKLRIHIATSIKSVFGKKVVIERVSGVAGGCINHCYKLTTGSGNFFVKINRADLFPGMFESEEMGLKILGSAGAFYVPEVVGSGELDGTSFLILGFIESGKRQNSFFEKFGEQLAHLHRKTSGFFGLDHDNYIGSLAQSNRCHNNWVDFFIKERLEKQIKLARDRNSVDSAIILQFNRLFNRLNEIFPSEKPSLLHGDLWSGNFMVAPGGGPALIDPSVYYGFREMDIGMTRLFGGFSPGFYESYNIFFPMEKGWEDRIDVCNLYPLMVHVNLFGGGYLSQVRSILQRF